MITVVNVRHDRRPEIIYVGRRVRGRAGSPLGNPFKVGEYEDPIGRYELWLEEQLQRDTPARREIERLVALHQAGVPLLLGCWCAPAPCHGDVIKATIERLARAGP